MKETTVFTYISESSSVHYKIRLGYQKSANNAEGTLGYYVIKYTNTDSWSPLSEENLGVASTLEQAELILQKNVDIGEMRRVHSISDAMFGGQNDNIMYSVKYNLRESENGGTERVWYAIKYVETYDPTLLGGGNISQRNELGFFSTLEHAVERLRQEYAEIDVENDLRR